MKTYFLIADFGQRLHISNTNVMASPLCNEALSKNFHIAGKPDKNNQGITQLFGIDEIMGMSNICENCKKITLSMSIGQQLKALRKKAGLTQKELALKLGNGGYSEFTVSAIEGNKRKVGFDVCEDWAKACSHKMRVEFDEVLSDIPAINKIMLQVKAKGYLSAQDVKQFYSAGVNVTALFGALTLEGNTTFQKRLKKGEISYDELVKALQTN